MFVLTADQRGSRRTSDRVPGALDLLADVPTVVEFERTAGDEFQGVPAGAEAVVESVRLLVRAGDWKIGIGVGTVEQPLPRSSRAARGEAFIAARTAVESARSTPSRIRVVGGSPYGQDQVEYAESALWLLGGLLRRRTEEGWEVGDLLGRGLSQRAVAERLGVSASAVSQRVARSGFAEERRAVALAVHLLDAADRAMDPTEGATTASGGIATSFEGLP